MQLSSSLAPPPPIIKRKPQASLSPASSWPNAQLWNPLQCPGLDPIRSDCPILFFFPFPIYSVTHRDLSPVISSNSSSQPLSSHLAPFACSRSLLSSTSINQLQNPPSTTLDPPPLTTTLLPHHSMTNSSTNDRSALLQISRPICVMSWVVISTVGWSSSSSS